MEYPHLFSPIQLNNLTLRNRIVAAPIGELYEPKARGGAGLVVCGHTIVEPGRSSFASGEEPTAFFKYEVEKTRQKIRACHRYGARASIEIFHAGQYARVKDHAWGPCSFTREDNVEVKALDSPEMERIAGLFAEAAQQAKTLGFDAIFLHFGHGWLAAQFLSPLFNHRTDEYGGSLPNRARFPLLILRKIREAVGPDFPVDMRISGEECVPGSIRFEDTLAFIQMAEPYIDGVQISAGLDINHEGNVHMATTNFKEHMPNLKWARTVKKTCPGLVVSVVGAIMNPSEAEQILANGDVDLVAFGRAFIADPNWPNKAREGRTCDIVPCLRCLQCYHIATNRQNVGCSVNPRYCNETLIPERMIPAEQAQRVVIVGAGPAGLNAAITASRRGHEVIVLEKSGMIGGALNTIAQEYYKEDIRSYRDYLANQFAQCDIDLRLNTAADRSIIEALHPQALIIACGAQPVTPPVPGIDQSFVVGFTEAIHHPERIGKQVVIIGGGTIGAEIGLELAEREGRQVTIVEMTDTLASQGNLLYRIALRQKLDSLTTFTALTRIRCVRIGNQEVEVIHQKETRKLKADTVIIAAGVRPDRAFVNSLYGICPQTFEAGDALQPRKIQEAVFEGTGVALSIG